MLRPPSLTQVLRYPVTTFVAGLALAVTGMWWSGQSIDGMVMNGRVWADWELWRALTSTLPHVNFFHLAFNLYWFWTFGTLVERVYGHLRCAGIFLLLAFGSSLAQFTFFSGGVGLSGVGYGLWGMLWVLEKRDARFADAVDQQTSQLFVFWFFLCIVLTIANVMPVANAAHGAGAVMGALLGLAASSRGAVRWRSIAGLVAVVILGLAGATVFWPWVNLTSYAQPVVEQAGLDALTRNNIPRGVKLLELSTRMRRAPARTWYNLGTAYQALGKYDDALAAYEHAAQMPDADNDMQQAAQQMKDYLTGRKSVSEQEPEPGHQTNAVPAASNPQTNQ
ncbi:MAG TPA: rhomboid family intramembrane serine protease [Verrucomicrobiae bacterium]|nr:rhomboid family intramembrane serine protease [Verrucomicrobiae bacterium]